MHLLRKVVLATFLNNPSGSRRLFILSMQHAYVITWDGCVALQFITGQPQKGAAIEAIAFPARPPRLSGARWRAGLC